MNLLLTIIIFSILGGVVSLVGGALLLTRSRFVYKFSHYLSSFAAGSLLGAAFFDLLPEAIHEADAVGWDHSVVFLLVLSGIIFFFLLERFLHWFHHHDFEEHEIKNRPIVPLVIIGDTVHNFVDGIAIAATFMVSVPAGIITTLAVGAHEIPQEIGDFGVLLKNGLSRFKVLYINFFSALAAVLGATIAFFLGGSVTGLVVVFLSISAGFFLYIALSDLIPEIHHENRKGMAFWETVCLIFGVLAIYFSLYFLQLMFPSISH